MLKRFVLAVGTLTALSGIARASLVDGNADVVLGQSTFGTNGINSPDIENGVNNPLGVAADPTTGRVYVADSKNNRILWWNSTSSLRNGQAANGVLGQADFSSVDPNRGGATGANTFHGPTTLTVDGSGNLWVADTYNYRVLRFPAPVSTGTIADVALGKGNLSDGGITASATSGSLGLPFGVTVDGSGRVWVADTVYHRVLRFSPPFAPGTNNADIVLGQANFTSGSPDRGGTVGPDTLNTPQAVTMDRAGHVWVADSSNGRVLRYSVPITTGMPADFVLGQPNFTSGNIISASDHSVPGVDDVKVDGAGNVWVADGMNSRVLRFPAPFSTGKADILLGQADFLSGGINGTGTVGQNTFYLPFGLALDNLGLWVADTRNSRLLHYDAFRLVSVIARGGVTHLTLTGSGFLSPAQVTLGRSGESNIVATNVVVVSPTQITCDVDLMEKRPGLWNVTVTASGFVFSLPNGFGIEPGVKAAPSPYNPMKDAGLNFLGLSGASEVKIFTMTGELVKDLSGTGSITWDGKDSHGSVVASGVYLAKIKDDSGTKKIKFAVQK